MQVKAPSEDFICSLWVLNDWQDFLLHLWMTVKQNISWRSYSNFLICPFCCKLQARVYICQNLAICALKINNSKLRNYKNATFSVYRQFFKNENIFWKWLTRFILKLHSLKSDTKHSVQCRHAADIITRFKLRGHMLQKPFYWQHAPYELASLYLSIEEKALDCMKSLTGY